MDAILDELEPEKTFLVSTTETKLILHWYKGYFFVHKFGSRDPRYCVVTSIDGNKEYTPQDLDLHLEIEYMHPKLLRPVNAGRITSINVR